MTRGLGLVYYNGQDWKTFDGKLLPINMKAGARYFSGINSCDLPDDYIIEILATKDGHLLIANQIFGFEYLQSKK